MASLNDPLVRQLLEGRYIATLASHSPDGSIHMVAVWHWFDGAKIYVATSSRSRKARNIQERSSVSVMIDSRDLAASCGVTIAGTAQILSGTAAVKAREQVHCKYLSEAALADPRVGPIFTAFDDVVIAITPMSVISWDMRFVDRQFFGGAMENNASYLLPLAR